MVNKMKKQYWNLFVVLLVSCFWSQQSEAVPTYSVHEIGITTTNPYTNPYTEVSVTATFNGPTKQITIPGFWDGGSAWKIRVAPTETGTWTLTSVTSNDGQLNNQSVGTTFSVTTPTGQEIANNAVLQHGFVKTSNTLTYQFEHADGTPFFFIADTLWGGRCTLGNHYQTGKFQQIVDDRVSRGFTVLTLCNIAAGLAIGNEGGNPFIGNHTSNQLNPAFFQYLDLRVDYMTKKGIRPTLVLGAPDAGLTSNTVWLTNFSKYLVARYAAYDVIWFGVKEYEEWGGNALNAINAYGNAILANDPYAHPMSTHTLNTTSELNGQAWLSFHAMQSNSINTLKGLRQYNKPMLIAESHYEQVCGYSGPWSYSNHDVLLSAIWKYYLNNGVMGGHFSPCYDIDQFIANLNTTSINYHEYLTSFMTSTGFKNLVSHPELVLTGSSIEFVAQDVSNTVTGNEYIAYLPSGGNVTLNLSHANGTLSAKWYNPRTNSYSGSQNITPGNSVSFTSPAGNNWVLYITSGVAPPLLPPVPDGLSLDIKPQ